MIANPHSVAARVSLLDEWAQQANPQAALLELQLYEHRGLSIDDWDRVPDEIERLIREKGDGWAEPLRSYVKGFRYELGLVASVGMTGEAFVAKSDELIRTAPLVRLTLSAPLDLAKVSNKPALSQIRCLTIAGGAGIDDEGIDALTRSPYIQQLRELHVANGSLSERGILRLISLQSRLPDLIYIDVSGNPGTDIADSRVSEINGRHYIIGNAGELLLREAYAATARGYSGQVDWPPLDSTFLFDNDE
ncbi:MAG: hypothetical protein AB7T06_16710 [Kofleriaceae bacterium]